jgi:hypothetical protein
MDILKKHYEKVILVIVLLGLVAAAAYLPFKISSEKQELEGVTATRTAVNVEPLTNLNLAATESTLKRVATPATLNLGSPNKLFNPMPWQKAADERLVPVTSVGPAAATVTNITPLYLRLTLDSVTVADTGPRYVIGVQNEAEKTPALRGKKQKYCSLNSKNEVFALVEVRGKPEEPTQLVLEMNDTNERAIVTKEVPFKRVEAYMADVRYDLEKKVWQDRRIGAVLPFNNEEYIIVAINQSEVVLSAKSNQKKWPIKYNPTAKP